MSLCGTFRREISWLERHTLTVLSRVCRIEAFQRCAEWADRGYNSCISWDECHWYTPWNCIAGFFCRAFYWISKWTCILVDWIYTTFCRLALSLIFFFVRQILILVITIPCPPGSPTLDPRIRHIFVLVLENRSFDHMFGATAIRGTDAATGKETEIKRRPDGDSNKYRYRDKKGIVHEGECVVGIGQKRSVLDDPGHEFGNTLLALGLDANGNPPTYPPYPLITGKGYAQNFADKVLSEDPPKDPCTVMWSYTEKDVPVITSLAREFVVCDHWFSSMPGPTWPNRYFFHAASSAGLDDSPSAFDSSLTSQLSGLVFDNGTIYDMLDSENISWAVYHGDYFPQVASLAGMDLLTISTHFHDMDDFEEDLTDGSMANFVFLEPDYGDDIIGNTYKCGNSQHPLDDITHGEALIKRVYEAIRSSPLWEQSLLIITYDEGGGFYDHAHPGQTVPPGDSVTDPVNNHHSFDFKQLGVRVPAVVCSPWIPRNLVDHREYEHASVPATVERLWGLPAMTERDKNVRDLGGLLSLSAPRTDAQITLPAAAAADREGVCP